MTAEHGPFVLGTVARDPAKGYHGTGLFLGSTRMSKRRNVGLHVYLNVHFTDAVPKATKPSATVRVR
jgi:hypothetical protein